MQDLSNITTLDLVIVALYLLGMLGIGVYFVRRIQNAGDYYVAGRSLGPLVLAGTVCATIIGGRSPRTTGRTATISWTPTTSKT